MVFSTECYGNVEDASSGDKHTCTFHHVYPDGDVHWFHGSHNLSDLAKHTTTKQVDNEGWLTVRSEMLMKHSDKPYNCSLMNTKSGRYIGSTLIQISRMLYTDPVRNGVESQGHVWTFLCISIILAVTMK